MLKNKFKIITLLAIIFLVITIPVTRASEITSIIPDVSIENTETDSNNEIMPITSTEERKSRCGFRRA